MGQSRINQAVQIALIIACGLAQAISLASPASGEAYAWLQVFALAVFLYTQQNNIGQKKNFWQSWLFTTVWLIASVWWLYISIHHFGGMPVWLTVAAIGLLCGALALYYAAALYLYFKWKNKHNHWLSAALFASCWTLGELARAEIFTGFPWGAIGYAHIDSVLVSLAPWVGVYGVAWVAAYIAALIDQYAWILKQNKTKYAGMILSVIGLAVMAVPWKIKSTSMDTSFSVSLLQGNIPQEMKFTQAREDSLKWYLDHALAATTDLVVMPETAIPYLKKDLPQDAWQTLSDHFGKGEKALILGIPTFEQNKGFGNSAIALQANAQEYIYNKQHLVPFGEFVPSYFKWFNQAVNFGITDFVRGPLKPAPFIWRNHHIAIQICYEDLFGEELAQRFVDDVSSAPTVLVNMSNIAWFGNTVVIPQHLHIARMRSIELNRPTVRATNSGGTAIIDASGRVIAKAQPYTTTVLVGDVPSSDGRVTGYAQWAGRWGLIPLWIWCIGIVMLFAISVERSSAKAQSH